MAFSTQANAARARRAGEAQQGVTLRSVGVGLAVVLAADLLTVGVRYLLQGSLLNSSHFPASLLIVFLVLMGGNRLVRAIRPVSELRPPELMLSLAMGFLGTTAPNNGLAGFFIGVIASPYYFATQENGWAETFHAHIPSWIVPHDTGQAVTWFFEGLPSGAAIPWGAWVVPLCWWATFICAIAFASACIVVLLRRAWAEHERLPYPLLAPVLEMVQKSEAPALARSRLFWIGFSLPAGALLWNALGYFWPLLPQIPVEGTPFYLGRAFPAFYTRIDFFTIAFAYFARLDALFSLWFFYLLHISQVAFCTRMGYSVGGRDDTWASFDAMLSYQGFGAFAFMVLWGLWTAREPLRAAFRKAFWGDPEVDDTGEMMSYRTAVFGLLFSFTFLVLWFRAAGMEVRLSALNFFALFLLYVGIARIVAETGLTHTRTSLTSQSAALAVLGTSALSPASLATLGFTYTIISGNKGLFLTALTHTARLGDMIGGNRRRVFAASMAGLALGVVASVAAMLYLSYRTGAFNFNVWSFTGGGQAVFNRVVIRMHNPTTTEWPKLAFAAVGAGAMGVLTLLRYRLPWWPLHPLGLAASHNWMRGTAFSILIIWAVKLLILQIGGVSLYRRCIPFFVGMLVGYIAGVAAVALIDAIWFPGMGHVVHT